MRTREESDALILKAISNSWLTTAKLDVVASVFDGLCDARVNQQTIAKLETLVADNATTIARFDND